MNVNFNSCRIIVSFIFLVIINGFLYAQTPVNVTVLVNPSSKVRQIPDNFIGISYEIGSIYSSSGNTQFTPANTPLMSIMTTAGIKSFRIGAASIQAATWTGMTRSEISTTPGLSTVSGFITPDAVDKLFGFAASYGAKVIFGINMGEMFNPHLAAQESNYIYSRYAKTLDYFEFGNEPDEYGSLNVEKTWSISGWNVSKLESDFSVYTDSVRLYSPVAPISGPASSWNYLSYTVPFATAMKGQINLLTQHYYSLSFNNSTTPSGPVIISSLLSPSVISSLKNECSAINNAASVNGMQWRMSESNSVTGGTNNGASNAFASALWALDYLYTLSSFKSCTGVNFHSSAYSTGGYSLFGPTGGGYGPNGTYKASPIYYGLLAFNQGRNGTLVNNTITNNGLNFSSYSVLDSSNTVYVTLINKDTLQTANVNFIIGSQYKKGTYMQLIAPSVSSKIGTVTFGGAVVSNKGTWTPSNIVTITANGSNQFNIVVPAASAMVITIPPTSTANFPPTVSLTSPSNNANFCIGTSLTMTGIASDQDGAVASVKFYNGNTLLATDYSAPYSFVWSNPTTGTSVIKAVATDNLGATSTSIGINVIINPLPNAIISPSGATTFCLGSNVTLTSNLSSSYLWKNNGTVVGTSRTLIVGNSGSYNVTVQDVNGCIATSSNFSVVVNPLPVATITTSGITTLCQGSAVTLTSSPSVGYSWSRNGTVVGTSMSYTASLSGSYLVKVTNSNNCTGSSLPITVVVNPLPVATITSSGPTAFCHGGSVALSSNSASAYSWQRNGTLIGTARTFVATVSGAYTVSVTDANGCPSGPSAVATVTVNGLVPVSVGINPSALQVCSGSSVSFTATGINVGTVPVYKWYVNNVAVGTGPIFSYVPVNADLVKVGLTAAGTCLTGNPAVSGVVPITVNPLTIPTVSVTPSSNPTCSNTGVVYTAVTSNVGTLPTYTWLVNGAIKTGTAPTFGYSPSNNDVIQAIITAGGAVPNCLSQNTATSTGVKAVVNSAILPALSIVPSSTSICQGGQVTFTTSASGTGSSPVYHWYVNNALQISTAPTFTFVPSNGQTVRASLVPGGSGVSCLVGGAVTSTGVTISVSPNVVPIANISSSMSTVCSGVSVTFTASSANLGNIPTYSWYVNNQLQNNGNTYNYLPNDGDRVTAIANAGGTLPQCLSASSATSSGIGLTVNPAQRVSVAINANAVQVCAGHTVTFTAIGTNVGTSPTVTWYANGLSQGTGNIFTYVPSVNDQVQAVVYAGGILPNCLSNSFNTSNMVSLTVNELIMPSIRIFASATSICSGTGVTFNATTSGVGTSPAIAWLVNNIPTQWGGTILDYTPSNGDIVNALVTVGGASSFCLASPIATSNGINITAKACLPPTNASITGPSFVSPGSVNVVYSVPYLSGDNYLWTVPVGATITNGQGSNSISVSIDSVFNDFIGVSQSNSYGTVVDQLYIQSGLLPLNQSIIGDTAVLQNSTGNIYSVVSIAGVNYQWTVPDGTNIIKGQGTSSITVSFGTGISGQIVLRSTNVFGSTSSSLQVLTGAVPTVGKIIGDTLIVAGQTNVNYSVNSTLGSTYTWTVPDNAVIISGQGTNSIIVNYGQSPNGVVTVLATNAFGSSNAVSNINEEVITEINDDLKDIDVKLFPNPTEGTFNVKVSSGDITPLVTVIDNNGKIVIPEQSETEGLGITLSSGHYIVTVKTNRSVKRLSLVKIQ